MANINQVRKFYVGASGSVPTSGVDNVVAVAAATFYTDAMNYQFTGAYAYIEFYSDAAGTTPVTPTAGTIVFEGSPGGNTYLVAANSASISATSVIAGSGTYTPPYFDGEVNKGRVTLTGITGAAYFRAWFWRV